MRKHIRCYWTFEGNSSNPSSDEVFNVLAEGLELSFNLSETTEQIPFEAGTRTTAQSGVYGPMTVPMRLKPARHAMVFGVCFRPGGAGPFFSHQVNELKNSCAGIDDIWELKRIEIIHRLQYDCETTEKRIDLLNRYFLHQIDKIVRGRLFFRPELKFSMTTLSRRQLFLKKERSLISATHMVSYLPDPPERLSRL